MSRILFESWRGSYSDSPRAISEYLSRTEPDIEQFWVIDDPAKLPRGLQPVERHSPRYFALLFTVDIVVANDIISRHLIKGPNVKYLQTWHGTPIKTIGLDMPDVKRGSTSAHHRRVLRDVRKWDALLSSGPLVTSRLRQAFGYDGPVLETGYPKNDRLLSPDADAARQEIRTRLGIVDDTYAVLYAPTWRDTKPAKGGGFEDPGGLDVETFLHNTPSNVSLLRRMHRLVRSRRPDTSARVLEVSDVDDMTDLILAADLLVTDYSSVVFDFALTRKPLILFPYDLHQYESKREFYVDYEEWAPGPIVRNTQQLAAAVTRTISEQQHAGPRSEFLDQYCPREDGRATERVYDQFVRPILEGRKV